MNWLERIISMLEGEMECPAPFGWYHLMCIGLTALVTIVLCMCFKKPTEKQLRTILLTYAAIGLTLEVYKQLVYSYDAANNVWDYQWYALPFQFCDTPIYSALIAGLCHKGRVRSAFLTYLSTYGLLAGTLVMSMPGDCFTRLIGINIHTMVQHGGQLAIGLFLLIRRVYAHERREISGAFAVFGMFIMAAMLGNIAVYNLGINEVCNLFYISPYYPSTLPVYSSLYNILPYPVFVAAYVLPFTLGAWIIYTVRETIEKKLNARSGGGVKPVDGNISENSTANG